MVKSSGDKTLDQVLLDIEKQFGNGAVMKLGEREHQKIDTISSGSISLDIALGIGGYPKGRIIEIFGPESSGKTTFALHAIAEVQKKGGRAAFIDAEHALDPVYAKNLGVNIIMENAETIENGKTTKTEVIKMEQTAQTIEKPKKKKVKHKLMCYHVT